MTERQTKGDKKYIDVNWLHPIIVVENIKTSFEELPEEARLSAKMVLEQEEYEDSYQLYLHYDRPETDDEMNKRLKNEEQQKKYRLAEYKQLKKEFEGQ